MYLVTRAARSRSTSRADRPLKLEFHRENRTHRAETHRYFNIRFFGQMPPDASDFPGGIPVNTSTSRRGSRILESGGGAWGVGDKLAVRPSQVCAPGGSEGMPPRNF